ncbi:putative late blight resistance protein homolog R1A-3 [Olea europaea var. sylvestris]|uniref:putative late blight resistance protein homolog R1A-3 n=1 Tax=Olea europaea var. sylvestris TaxID=158386 RepID=UPI000C1D2960|nr:putative late blight resistance protein homolog R1A-3 [Olea europaea var. sylvestris]
MMNFSNSISLRAKTKNLSIENLSRLVKNPGLLSHLQDLKLDGEEKNLSFQWLGPHFLTFLKYATEVLQCLDRRDFIAFNMHDLCDLHDLLKYLDDSAYCILYGEIFSRLDKEHCKKFLEIILTFMPELNKFFTIQTPISNNSNVNEHWEIFIDFLFESIRELLSCQKDSTVLVSNRVKILQQGLNFLLTFLVYPIPSDAEEQKKSIFTEIEAVFNEAGLFLHSFFFTTDLVTSTKMDLAISVLLERIEVVLVKMKYYSIAVSSEVGIGSLQVAESPSHVSSSQDNSSPMAEEIVVGLEDMTTQIVNKLVGGPKRRQIISIVGMGGLGKTTSAKKIYDHSNVAYYFDKLSWCVVSQSYNKRKLLIDILSSLSDVDKEEMLKMKDEDLAEVLYKNLKGRRYLVVMDDLWDKEAWEDLKRLFPEDTNGSRVLFTSRLKNVASKISQVIIEPPLLSPGDSWNLLEQKVFKKECCPRELQDIGKQIAANCKGLPLLVVLIAGILSKMEKNESLWRQVAESLRCHIFQKADDYIPTLKLSYIHLPNHLKPCFLYLIAFQEEEEIPVRKLLLLWIAEGLIEKKEHESLEHVAEEYLMELIDRSLLQVVKRRSNNRVKACNLHDLVLDMCQKIYVEEEMFPFQQPLLISESLRRLFMDRYHHHHLPGAFSISVNLEKNRILDSWKCGNSRLGIKIMPDLRYLSSLTLEPSVGKLHHLEYLRLKSVSEVPSYLLSMPKLIHLYVNNKYHISRFTKDCDGSQINCLQTLRYVRISDPKDEAILRCSPNLRTLKCETSVNHFPDLNFLSKLESLSVLTYGKRKFKGDYSVFKFPMNIKKLTLLYMSLSLEIMSLIGTLPNLEILKLECTSFEGKIWDTKDDEFQKLKYLELYYVYLEDWNSSEDHFPILERLVLKNCNVLKAIPFEFGKISTLQEIVVYYCRKNAETSALKIHQEQRDYGNEDFEVHIKSF